ncbi:XRE family transcriptional regulator [Bombilactobacillus thymidiniphilus]|uniref:XRE family transcriptional regulator n=1 Tax=Bombilactobacillus thymidiniphilus TaxID=2923363 RepID=A0ABY4PCN1_9LACO|nr:XRE family transcriptional regulator [Bombilactobacillus thymidiniphilus]UQS83523.1 XRE family transcriptional regulator [Bombilactobacillus thymidiniphilus]
MNRGQFELENVDKSILKKEMLRPKTNLRQERLIREYSTSYMAKLIGLSNRRQYEQKERGRAPFHDYEMMIISQKFLMSINYLFFDDMEPLDS